MANQREHLILLLANVHIRQFPKPDQQPKVCPSQDTTVFEDDFPSIFLMRMRIDDM